MILISCQSSRQLIMSKLMTIDKQTWTIQDKVFRQFFEHNIKHNLKQLKNNLGQFRQLKTNQEQFKTI